MLFLNVFHYPVLSIPRSLSYILLIIIVLIFPSSPISFRFCSQITGGLRFAVGQNVGVFQTMWAEGGSPAPPGVDRRLELRAGVFSLGIWSSGGENTSETMSSSVRYMRSASAAHVETLVTHILCLRNNYGSMPYAIAFCRVTAMFYKSRFPGSETRSLSSHRIHNIIALLW